MIKKLILFENLTNKTIVNVDIQPEYEDGFGHGFVNNWIDFLNESNDENIIIFLYNGKDTTGGMSKDEYFEWLLEYGLNEYVLEQAIFYDKGYAFFRNLMDTGVDEDAIVDFIKYMYNHNINDSRDLDEEMWNDFMEQTDNTRKDVRDIMEFAEDCINIPELMEFLKKYRNIVLTGGVVLMNV